MKTEDLHRKFPESKIHWRAGMVRNGKALALAYIDARDVMNRLDEVVGPENWTDSYSVFDGRVICRLGIRIGEGEDTEWVTKSDGAGDTDVEGEKGAISDAFKRAAVKWGVGRYLYDIKSPWVPCETYQGNDGKPRFSKFKSDPWEFVKAKPEPVFAGPHKKMALEGLLRDFCKDLDACEDGDQLQALLASSTEVCKQTREERPSWWFGVEGSDVPGVGERISKKERELREAAEFEPPKPSRPVGGNKGAKGDPSKKADEPQEPPSPAASPPDDGSLDPAMFP